VWDSFKNPWIVDHIAYEVEGSIDGLGDLSGLDWIDVALAVFASNGRPVLLPVDPKIALRVGRG
jgi:hypothetical protein